jgi:hydrogenase nickel incorporation protein HypA/HybF
MHEFSIATQILESVLEYAAIHPKAEVLVVRLEIGELMCVDAGQLQFCYDSIKIGSPLENSRLEIEFLPAVVKCAHCDYEGGPKYWEGALADSSIATLQCPGCGRAAQAVAGRDCAIKSVQMFDSSNEDERDSYSAPTATL